MHKMGSRFIYMIIVGIIISFLLNLILKSATGYQYRLLSILVSILITIGAWEGNLRIDFWMNRRFHWQENPGRRALLQLLASTLYSAVLIYVFMLGFKHICAILGYQWNFITIATIFGIMVSFILLSLEIGMQFFGNWKHAQIEVEKYKTESLQAQVQNLKNQINPHFLFNNMSVLSSLVYKDQDKAVDFINQLSKVYRYLLDSKNSELVTLKDELTFIHSYIYLLQIRFDKSIIFIVDVEDTSLKNLLPPMALQILVENAVKHNEISEVRPLTINIKATHHVVQISNNLQVLTNIEVGSKTGLKNIIDRYRYFTTKPIKIIKGPDVFNVQIPLLISK